MMQSKLNLSSCNYGAKCTLSNYSVHLFIIGIRFGVTFDFERCGFVGLCVWRIEMHFSKFLSQLFGLGFKCNALAEQSANQDREISFDFG